MIDGGILSQLPLFVGAPRGVIETLAARGSIARYSRGAVIFSAGSKPRGWYIVITGRVRVLRITEGRQHVVHTESAGGTLGEVPLFTGGTHPATAVAAEATTCALFTLSDLRAAMRDGEAVALILLARLAHRVQGLVERLNQRSAESVRSRLERFVDERSQLARTRIFTLGMTQHQLAEELGTVREVVSRELRAMVQSGRLISAGSGRYRLLTK